MSKENKNSFLKKRKKKDIHEMKVIDQKKMNRYFAIGTVGFMTLCGLTVVSSFARNTTDSGKQAKVETVVKKTDTVDNRLQVFVENYISAYFNFSVKDIDSYNEKLNKFYNFVPETKNQGQVKVDTKLVSYRLEQISETEAKYRVTYETEGQKLTVLFGVPYGGKEGRYYVSGLPFFQAVVNFKADDVEKKKLCHCLRRMMYLKKIEKRWKNFSNCSLRTTLQVKKILILCQKELRPSMEQSLSLLIILISKLEVREKSKLMRRQRLRLLERHIVRISRLI